MERHATPVTTSFTQGTEFHPVRGWLRELKSSREDGTADGGQLTSSDLTATTPTRAAL